MLHAGTVQSSPEVLVGGLRPGQGQVCADGVVEQVTVLHDHTHGLPQGFKGGFPNVLAAQSYSAGVDVVQARHQLGDRGFTRARGPHQGHRVTGLGAEGDPVQHFLTAPRVEDRDVLQGGQRNLVGRGVGEVDAVELHGRGAGSDGTSIRRLADQGLDVQHLKNAFKAHHGAHDVHVGIGQHGQRRI